MRVLLFPSNTEIAYNIADSLYLKKDIITLGASSVDYPQPNEEQIQVISNIVPYCKEPLFIEFMEEIIQLHKVDLIIPCHDDVCLALSSSKLQFMSLNSEYHTNKICRSKLETYNLFSKYDFCPKYYISIDQIKDYPVFIKPIIGQGSSGIMKIDNQQELCASFNSNLIICEYLPGKEYTIDCLTLYDGTLEVIIPRTRSKVRSGITVESEIEFSDKITEIANQINQKLKFKGAWFFQLKKDSNNYFKLLEIAPRVGGSMLFHRINNINLPYLSVLTHFQIKLKSQYKEYSVKLTRQLKSSFITKYNCNKIYMDFDDCLYFTNLDFLNPEAVSLIIEARNKKIPVILISRHKGDLNAKVNELGISSFFSEIIHLNSMSELKSNFMINSKNSIFIDDSFRERSDVLNKLNIPVFDISEIKYIKI